MVRRRARGAMGATPTSYCMRVKRTVACAPNGGSVISFSTAVPMTRAWSSSPTPPSRSCRPAGGKRGRLLEERDRSRPAPSASSAEGRAQLLGRGDGDAEDPVDDRRAACARRPIETRSMLACFLGHRPSQSAVDEEAARTKGLSTRRWWEERSDRAQPRAVQLAEQLMLMADAEARHRHRRARADHPHQRSRQRAHAPAGLPSAALFAGRSCAVVALLKAVK